VRVVVPDFGGGFGGKHTPDVAVEAARLAHASGRPVSVRWTREEEFSWGYLRPAAVIDVRAAGRDGALVAWDFTNINSGAAALNSPYAVANLRERYQPAHSPLPQGSYRALAATANTFARESHMDDLAAALSVDPVEFRLRHLTDTRLAHALSTLAEGIDWSRRAQRPGYGLGIACGIEKDTRVATAAEVAVDPDGTLHVLRVVTCVDCGAIVDPTGLRNQIIGATIMGLGGALFEQTGLDNGRISTASFSVYRVPRFTDVPPIEVTLIDQPTYASAGAGETPIIAVAPAIANAVFAATGRRLRDLPLAPDNLVR
jgi:isoquinoline 1-oxidoreductase